MIEKDKQAGLARRTQVMGEAFATRAMSDLDGFSRPLQDWLNEHAWQHLAARRYRPENPQPADLRHVGRTGPQPGAERPYPWRHQ